jgi:mono/diheme cytochrome c family protein
MLLALASAAALAAGRVAHDGRATPTYETDVLPLLRTRCLGCHGAGQPKSGLDLRTLGNVLQGGSSGPAVSPGLPEKSRLYTLVAARKMPPGPDKLSPAEAARIAAWIRSGAKGTTAEFVHWAFKPPVRPAIPKIENPKLKIENPIDAFLLRDLRKQGLSYSPPADRRTLLRRVTFDLLGLPPTPAEMDAFLADRRPGAYERVVDRLLADPRYGERWARYWLDTAGYADSEGVLEEDRIRPNAWRYRDYVIRSLNADKPYDQFLREQIAGDELSDYRHAKAWTPAIEEQVTATGFLRTAVDATRDDFNEHQFTEYQYRMLNDTETILVSTTLGLTLQCARCHDHKFEPLSQRDYYRVQAILAGAIRPHGKLLPTNRRQIVAGTAEDQKRAAEVNAKVDASVAEIDKQDAALLADYRLKALEAKIGTVPENERAVLLEAARTDPAKRTAAQKALAAKRAALLETPADALSAAYPAFKQKHGSLIAARAAEEKKRIALPEIRALYDQDAAPPPTQVLIRGELTRPGEPVEPGIPAVLDDPRSPFTIPAPPAGAATTGRRTALAAWITRPDNPLTARVLVNRVWAHHFGVGIVPTVENFGRSGAPPTNQPLLDWLASSFAANDERGTRKDERTSKAPHSTFNLQPSTFNMSWSLKKLHRLIVTSAAYRQSSAFRADAARVDPEDRLLWRQRARRLEAEAIRDSMLSVTGTLDSTMFGEPVGEEALPTGEIVPAGEATGGRRSVYLLVRRSRPVTFLNTFDAPIMETNCTRRIASTTATQALAVMNGGFAASQAARFADRLAKEGGATADSRVALAYRLAFNRAPRAGEMRSAESFLRAQVARYLAAGKKADEAERAALADFCQALLSANEFVYTD